jgi:putative membrane protein
MKREPSLWKGLLAGGLAGAAASWVMNRMPEPAGALERERERGHGGQSLRVDEPESGIDYEDEDATMKVATRVARQTTGRELGLEQRQTAGVAVHYAFGTTVGAIYGAVKEVAPEAARGLGVPFGATVWLAANAVLLPSLGLSRKPEDMPAWVEGHSFAGHLVYGVSTELFSRVFRRLF